MKKLLFLGVLVLSLCASVQAQYAKVLGVAGRSTKVVVSGISSTNNAFVTYPLATIDIYNTGTTTHTAIFSNTTGTVKANPFSATTPDAYYDFFVSPGTVFDVRISGVSGGVTITPFTRSGLTAPTSASSVFNVLLFGAACDGTTDDSTAIQAALTAAGVSGGTVTFPPSRCLVSTGLTVSSNTKVIGNGYISELFFQNGAHVATGLGSNSASHVEIADLRITGSTATPTLSRGIYVNGGSDIRIRHVYVSGANVVPVSGPLAGIGVVLASDVWVTDCEFTGNGNVSIPVQSYDLVSWNDGGGQQSGIHFLRNRIYGSSTNYSMGIFDANDSEIVGNIIDQNNKANETTSSGYGIFLYGASFTGNRNRVSGNTVSNSGGTGIYAVAMNYVQVENNILLNNALQQTTGSLARGGIAIDGSAGAGLHCAILGNIVIGSGQHGITYPTASYGTITGNTIRVTVLSGINVPAAVGSVIADNTIELAGDAGIYALLSFTRSRVTHNIIDHATTACIDITSATDFGVDNNTGTSCGASGVVVRATSNRGSISHNQLKGNGASNVLFQEMVLIGTNLTVSHNTLLTTTVTNGLDTSSAVNSIIDHNIVTGYTNGLVLGGAGNRVQDNVLDGNTNPFSGALSTSHVTGVLLGGEGSALTVSTNTIAPTSQIHQVGAGLIKTITVPAGLKGESVYLVPTAAFTYDATGNILGTGTAVIGRTMIATYSITTGKWSMSY